MPSIDLSILNQRQTPAFYADTLANRPAAGFVGRIFVSTDTFAFFRDNGTGWDLIGGPGTGTVTGSGTAGQVTYWSGASTVTGDNGLFYDSVNDRLGVGTTTPGAAIDAHSTQNTILQLNQTTATNDTRIAFQNNGTSLWRIGNLYNAGANDFEIFDVVGAQQSLTVKKTTGQVLIGTTSVGSGKLVVASATSDNHIQIVGATAPSLRIDSATSGPTKRIGIGLATAVNNFIQNSQNLDMCIFNGSTSAAGNMLFGIYDTGLANIQEAARISSARNFLIGTITDTGQKLQVSGTALITGAATFSSSLAVNGNILYINGGQPETRYTENDVGSLPLGLWRTVLGGDAFYVQKNTAVAGDFSTVINCLQFASTGAAVFSNSVTGRSYGVNNGTFRGGLYSYTDILGGGSDNSIALFADGTSPNGNIYFCPNGASTKVMSLIGSSGNLLIGTTTDAGQKLQVNGTALFASNITITNAGRPYLITQTTNANEEAGIQIAQTGSSNWYIGTAQGSSTPQDLSIRDVQNGRITITVKASGVINFQNVPTSAAGLVSGDIYRTAGVLNIVP